MKKFLIVGIAVIVLIVCVVGSMIVGKYNTLVSKDLEVDNAQSQVEVVLQRRYDLIPNLVESVKGVMTQEQEVFGAIAEARTKYGSAASGSSEKIDASNNLESALSRLLVVMENYPELKSNQTVQGLMDELAGTENRIAVERKRYNDVVTEFNTLVKTFPNNLYAKMLGFSERSLFEAVTGADTVPDVDLPLD